MQYYVNYITESDMPGNMKKDIFATFMIDKHTDGMIT